MPTRPNILFLMTDQQRWDALGCAARWVRTPNMDFIAAEGIRFSRCMTTSPECVPARVSLATGLYPHDTGVWRNMSYTLSPRTATWMQAIRAAGYRTSLFGKTHWHPHRGDIRAQEHLLHAYGFDDVVEVTGPRASMHCLSHMTARWQEKQLWEPYRRDLAERFASNPLLVRPSTLPLEEYYDVYVGRQAVRYLTEYERPEPWFCWVSFPGPHEPWDTPEPYASMYDPADMPPPIRSEPEARDGPKGSLDSRRAVTPRPTEEESLRLRANYAGNVTLIDDQIGEILNVIRARGEMDKTVILFTSDHGEMNGDHGMVYKSTFYRSAVNVPLLVRVPPAMRSGSEGSTSDNPVETIDVGPTLAELAGAPLLYPQCGRSLVQCMRDPALMVRDIAISEIFNELMVTDNAWKVAFNQEGRAYLLFDLQNDPPETLNYASRADMQHLGLFLRRKASDNVRPSNRSGVQSNI